MELDRQGEHRYLLHLKEQGGQYSGFILRLHQPLGVVEVPKYGGRYAVGGYRDKREAFNDGNRIARLIEAGELYCEKAPTFKERCGEYQLIATAAFHAGHHQWAPQLTVVSKRAHNKGERQVFDHDPSSPLCRGYVLHHVAERAALDAIEHGKRLVHGFTGGLAV